jgi:RNA polymerase sigma-70 factor (ECF subfamily)
MQQPLTAEEKSIVAAQRGDLVAFELLVEQYQPNVLTTAYHFMGNEMDADDVTQEVWIRVYRSLNKFRFKSSFSTWIYRITVNQSMTALKRRGRQAGGKKLDVRLDDQEREYPLRDKAPGPRKILEGKETIQEFRCALEALPKRQQMAVTLVLLQGLSHRQAGEIIGIAEKTVSWHLFKARARLMDKLEKFL